MKKKSSAEPTMTIHTKAATDDIYDIFNKPVANVQEDEDSDDGDDYDTDGDYTSGAESTNTTRHFNVGDELTEVGYDGTEVIDDTEMHDDDNDETSDERSVSEWSDFSTRRHVPNVDGDLTTEQDPDHEVSDLIDAGDLDHSEQPSGETSEQDNLTGEYDDGMITPNEQESPPRTRTSFVPVPPEDYEPRTRPFRDPVEAANNRLPFMTPITERTESSLDIPARDEDPYKTPSRRHDPATPRVSSSPGEFSSPLIDIVDSSPSRTPSREVLPHREPVPKAVGKAPAAQKGPIITDLQCNPVDDAIRAEILANIHPPLASYEGFYDRAEEKYEKGSEIRRFAKAMTKAQKSGDKTNNTIAGPVIQLPDIQGDYAVKKELGAGAFAPVYLVENTAPDGEAGDGAPAEVGRSAFAVTHRHALEALKMEMPPSAWEFYIMRQAHARLGLADRASASLSYAHEMHLFRDEGFLVLPLHQYGSLLDVVNLFRAEASGVMDEQLAMFFTVELLRTVEALHGKGLLHGDLKPDNCLLRLDSAAPLTASYGPDGEGGWKDRGLTLIDFGRGIDMRAFGPGVSFVADWKTTPQDCAEMREGRPWTWQIDYHGAAGIVYCLLFGRYIETVRADSGGIGSGRQYRIRESLKRYWQGELWGRCFDMLLNPTAHVDGEEGGRMPLLKGMKGVREEMEAWLVANCERGVGLRGLLGKVEAYARRR